MKNSVITQMFRGKRGNCNSIPIDDKYKELLQKLAISDKKLSDRLSKYCDLKELFEVYNEDFTILNLHMEECVFAEAFKFGLLIGLEINDVD